MSYKALYRTYRPSSFEEVVGQQHIVTTLKNAVKQNKIAHAYLFCGPRGTGKTSIAKLLAKAVNCSDHEHAPCNQCESCLAIQEGNHPDIVEIDAASNNGVDEIRDLIEKVKYSPLQGRYKVYIIDEVHMLSTGAFNALLKTLEEPPSHVIFILATTEPQKVLPTIISRCQRYDFSKVSQSEMIGRIRKILEQEKISCDDEALRLIAQLADGGMRDALSIVDQCIAYAQDNITAADVNEIYGMTTISEKIELLMWIFHRQAQPLLDKIRILSEKGIDIKRLTSDLIEVLKECVILAYTQDSTLLNQLTEDEALRLLEGRSSRELLAMIDILMETMEKYRNASDAASYFEVAALKMMAEREEVSSYSLKPQISDQSAREIEPAAKNNADEGHETLVEEEEAITEISEPVAEQIQETEIKPLNSEFILQLLVSADKETRKKDEEIWKLIEGKCHDLDLNCAKIANLLRNGRIVASGERFILLCVGYQALANQINDPGLQSELIHFLIENLKLKKHLFAITQEQFKAVTDNFRIRAKQNTLPQPVVLAEVASEPVEAQTQPQNEQNEILTKLYNLFGTENVKIMEEEEQS